MFPRGILRTSLVLALSLPLTTTLACSGSRNDPKTVVDVKAGNMPDGGEWEGVYYSQTYGFLHITEKNGSVTGAWRTVSGDKWGELFGEVEGDVLRYSWKEHKIGMIGPNATVEGKGFFRYTVPDSGEAHEIQGQWGLGEHNAGHTWAALKQNNMEPDPKSVRPDELESRTGAEPWDGAAGDTDITSKPEEAAPEGEESDESEK